MPQKFPHWFTGHFLKGCAPLLLSAKRALIDQPATICKHPCAPPPPSGPTQAPEAGAGPDGVGSAPSLPCPAIGNQNPQCFPPPFFSPTGGWVAEAKRHGSKVRSVVPRAPNLPGAKPLMGLDVSPPMKYGPTQHR